MKNIRGRRPVRIVLVLVPALGLPSAGIPISYRFYTDFGPVMNTSAAIGFEPLKKIYGAPLATVASDNQVPEPKT